MQRALMRLSLAALLLCLWGCRQSTEPAPAQLRLTAEAGVVEAWLTINVENAADAEVLITRDGAARLRFPAVAETTVVDTGLLPAHNYSYAARLVRNGQTAARSNSVELTTMDTTSHDFTWEIYEFGGQHGSSVLYDVAIINENDIWAVGEIHTAETDTFDSLGNWVNPYNAVHWNGSEWELKRIRTNTCGGVDYPPIKTIFSFSADDILFAHIDASITHYDGQSFLNDCSFIQQINGSINKIWGISSEDFYVVGGAGLIAHYDGSGWRRIESGTDINLTDIWGSDPQNIWICGYEQFKGTVVFHYDGFTLRQWFYSPFEEYVNLNPDKISGPIMSLWSDSPNYLIIITYWGLYKVDSQNPASFIRIPDINAWNGWTYRLRGNALNDLFFCGAFTSVWHFNGSGLHYFSTLSGNSVLRSIDMIDNQVIIVGSDYQFDSGIIYRGIRQ